MMKIDSLTLERKILQTKAALMKKEKSLLINRGVLFRTDYNRSGQQRT